VGFGGAGGFALTDPSMDFKSQAWTMFLVIKPNVNAAQYDQLLAFYAGGYYVKLQRNITNKNIDFQVINASTTYYLTSGADYGWSGNWVRVMAVVDSSGNGTLGVYNNGASINSVVTGNVGIPANVDYSSSYVGTSPSAPGTAGYWGEIAEIVVFNTTLGSTTTSAVQGYLTTRYGF
jgi:hypothetical protein